ncbi:MAG: tRNA uridine-5-carboxymethylaminomethyl(34) synthesis GTPase MnmE [Saprospiraceae bacterium]
MKDTIVALSTPQGEGAIGVIRLSGVNSIPIVDKVFYGKNLNKVEGNTVHYGKIKNEEDIVIDECLATVFKSPRSYTKEDIIEISCHGSSYILDQVIQLLVRQGARLALRGEFTLRAFLNGQLDLSQAEAVADLIASESATSHELAMKQLRGGISDEIKTLRKRLIKFASLIELENDFGEEDVSFADPSELKKIVKEIQNKIAPLISSFSYGNAIKKGIPVAIIGETNVGKSTLLNAILQEEKAIVSDIPGTTRDVIEDVLQLDGILFRFIDTAGIRNTEDKIESLGIERTLDQISKAKIILFVAEINEDYKSIVEKFNEIEITSDQEVLILINKADTYDHKCHAYDIEEAISTAAGRTKTLLISAKNNTGIDQLKSALIHTFKQASNQEDAVISSLRHYEALQATQQSLDTVINGIDGQIPTDLIAIDIRHAMASLGVISGEIYTDDLLDSIFRDFCIGK